MFDLILEDLQRKFPGKVLLSPVDIAPIIAASPKVQANMRSQGRFPVPIRKVGSKVGVSIYHLAEFIDTGNVVAGATDKPARPATSRDLPLRNRRLPTKRDKDWLLALQIQTQFQFELVKAIQYEFLENALPSKPETRGRKFGSI